MQEMIGYEKMKTAIIYHKSDLDGIGSAAIALRVFPDAELYPAEYNQESYKITDFKDKMTIVVDFCPEKIEEIREISSVFCWIDHHKSAMENHKELWESKVIDGLRSIENSAITLTWKWFYPHEPLPLGILYIEDYDIWKFTFGKSTKEFCEYASLRLLFPETIEWRELFEGDELLDKYIQKGNVLIEAKDDRIRKSFKGVLKITKWGYNVGALNTNHDISDVGNYICNNGYDVALVWRVSQRNGEASVISGLRSKDEVDVSKIAKMYGGGGHKNSSGFSLPLKEFIKLLEE